MRYSNDELNDLYELLDGSCFYCEKRISFKNYGVVGGLGAWEVDHFIPVVAGGVHHPDNWVPACVDCNTRKSDQLPWDFDPGQFAIGDWNPRNYL